MIEKNVSLKRFNTFGIDARAETLITVSSEEEVTRLIRSGDAAGPLLILGGGSNLLFISDFKGTVIKTDIQGINEHYTENGNRIISAGAGVNWDAFVGWSVDKGLGGAENLSLIPGCVGAVPVQNIGAYGAEASEIIYKVRALSLETGDVREFSREECRFGYRESIFKQELKSRYLISEVWFSLSLNPEFRIGYGSLREEIERIGKPDLKTIREAVTGIRRSKLPDPSVIGNAGSFFKNPVIEQTHAEKLISRFHDMPVYDDISGGKKIAAGWLIEKCGWKGKRVGNVGTSPDHALIICNFGNATGSEVLEFAMRIKEEVTNKFGIKLEEEVNIL